MLRAKARVRVDAQNEGQGGRAPLFGAKLIRMPRSIARALAAAVLWSFAFTAMAATAPSGREENGIRLGDARLHPFIDLELHYDSAAGYFPPNGSPPGAAPVLTPEYLAHFRPGVNLELPSDSLQLDFRGDLDYVYFTGLLHPGSQAASRLDAGADLNLGINRKGQLGLEVGDHLSRSDRTTNAAVNVGVISFFNEARLSVPWRPGGGALEIEPQGAVAVEFFDPITDLTIPNCGDITCDPVGIRGMDYYNLRGGVEARWKFLPKTAVVVEGNFDSRNYITPSAANPPASLLRGMAGVQGLLTAKMAIIAKLGWAADFATSGASTLIAQAEANYIASEFASIKGGYLRDVQPVPSYGTYGDDRFYVNGKILLFGRLALTGDAQYDLLSFYSGSKRSDQNLQLTVGPTYEITDWMQVAAMYILTYRSSSDTTLQYANYTRNEGYVRLSFTY